MDNTLTQPVGDVVDVTKINGASTFNVPKPAVDQNITLPSLAVTQTQQADTANQNETNTQNTLLELARILEGQTAFEQQAGAEAGIPTLNKDLLDLQKLQRQQTLSYLQGVQNIQNKPIAMEFVTGQQESLNRQRAIDVMATSTAIQAKQGDIQLAQDTVNRAVALKYDPIKARIETQKMILEQVSGKAAEARKNLLNTQLKQIEKDEKNETAIGEIYINAAAQGAPNDLLAAAKNAKTPLEAAQILGKYSGEYLRAELLREQIATEKKQREKIQSDINTAKGVNLKPLSGEASKMLSISSGLSTDINTIKNKIDKVGYEKFLRGYLLGTDRETVKLLSNAADKIGRLRSGGAINKDEEKRFLGQFASRGDYAFGTADIAKSALDSIMNEAETVRFGIDPNDQYSTKTMSSPEEDYVENSVVPGIRTSQTSTGTASAYAKSLINK